MASTIIAGAAAVWCSPGATEERRPGRTGVCGTSTNPSEHWFRVPVQPAAGVNMGLGTDCTNCHGVLGSIRGDPLNQCLSRKAGFRKPEGFSSDHKGDNCYENEPSKHRSESPQRMPLRLGTARHPHQCARIQLRPGGRAHEEAEQDKI